MDTNRIAKAIFPTVIGSVILILLVFVSGYFRRVNDTTQLAQLTAKTQVDVVELVKVLSERVKAEDAASRQDAKRCMQGFIKDREICGAAGVRVVE